MTTLLPPSRRSGAPLLVYILHSGNLYGTERMALATIEGLTEYPTCLVVATPPSETASVTLAAQTLGYRTLTFARSWQLSMRLLPWFLRYRHIDVIGVGVGSSILCHVLGRLFRVRLRQLQVAHGGNEDSWAYAPKRRLNKIPVMVVAVSEFVRQKLLAHGVRPDRIHVIENFLSTQQRREYQRRARYATDASILARQTRVAVVSRVDPIKRIGLLVEAIERHGLQDFHFDIYGTGIELETLRAHCATFPNLHFHGYVEDVKKRLAQADLLLHLCPVEPFGLAILEAFMTGLVAIVPDAGGAGDLVADTATGFRFHADDVDDLARVLSKARTTPAVRLQAVADAAARLLDERFSQERGIRRYRRALEAAELCGRG